MTTKTETKETFPKIEPAAVHNMFDPMAAWSASQQQFHKMMSEAYSRWQAWADEYATLEGQMFTRARAAIDTWAQVSRDTLAYCEQLSAQARKISTEAVRKASVGA